MAYQCLIVDDEALARELIATYLEQLDDFQLAGSCANAIEARKVLETSPVDLLFLDIEMPLLKGTEFLKALAHPPKVIFTTAYRDYAIEGFDLNAIDYLVKPIEFDRFYQAIDKFKSWMSGQQAPLAQTGSQSHFYLKYNKKNIRIQQQSVLYVESQGDYVLLHLTDRQIKVKMPLHQLEAKLDQRFLRIHRSFIVNTDKITAFTKQDVEIGNKEIPIGQLYKDRVLDQLLR